MRALAIPLALALALFVVYCAYRVVGHLRQSAQQRAQASARWRVDQVNVDERTVVVVRLTASDGTVLDEHVVARLRNDDLDWQRQFLHAQQEATERAFHLNADRPSL